MPTVPHDSHTASPAPQSKRARRADGRDSSGVHQPPRSPLDTVVPRSPVPLAHEPFTSPAPAAHTTLNTLATPRRLEQLKAAEGRGSAHTPMRTHVHTSTSPAASSAAALTSLVTPARPLSEKSSLYDTTPASGWRRRGRSSTAVASALSPAVELITPGRDPSSVDIVPGTPCSATDGVQTVGRTPSSLRRGGAAPAPPRFHDDSSVPGFRLPLGGADSPLPAVPLARAAAAAADTAPAPLGAIAAEHLASISSDRAVRSAMVAGPSGSDQCAVLHVVVRPHPRVLLLQSLIHFRRQTVSPHRCLTVSSRRNTRLRPSIDIRSPVDLAGEPACDQSQQRGAADVGAGRVGDRRACIASCGAVLRAAAAHGRGKSRSAPRRAVS